jgi:WD40 repeat protein
VPRVAAAGCVVVLYSPKRHKQVRFFRASKAVSSLTFSPNGRFLAVGEMGHQVVVMSIDSGLSGDGGVNLTASEKGITALRGPSSS